VTARTADQLLDLLAERAQEPDSAEPDGQVRVLAWHDHDQEALTAAWYEFRAAVLDRDALVTGRRDWTGADPGAGSQEAAVRRQEARIDAAYSLLAWGPAGGPS
jgi:hypothetical protein